MCNSRLVWEVRLRRYTPVDSLRGPNLCGIRAPNLLMSKARFVSMRVVVLYLNVYFFCCDVILGPECENCDVQQYFKLCFS